jgi:6,7-dimethyl-8-ribityllumazine synthase
MSVDPEAPRVAVVVSRFNRAVTDRLVEGAREAAAHHKVELRDADVYSVPGAFELAVAARAAARSSRYDAVVCLGAVIRGETPHFDYVCQAAAYGVQRVALDTGKPVAFGVLTTDDLAQASARAGGDFGNKGYDSFVCVLETLGTLERLGAS